MIAMTNAAKSVSDRFWIDHLRPTALDADENYQVEIRLSAPHRDLMYTRVYWGNVGLGTPWRHSPGWAPPAIDDCEGEPSHEPVVRTYKSISRAWHPRRGQWVLDAVADDGTAWCSYSLNDDKVAILWMPQLALPQPGQPGE